jgi:hypothetical protein
VAREGGDEILQPKEETGEVRDGSNRRERAQRRGPPGRGGRGGGE